MSEQRGNDVLAHLQSAVQEVIAAARTVLDVADELVTDPRTKEAVASTVSSLTDLASRAASGRFSATGTGSAPTDGNEGGDGPDTDPAGHDDGNGGVQHIRVE